MSRSTNKDVRISFHTNTTNNDMVIIRLYRDAADKVGPYVRLIPDENTLYFKNYNVKVKGSLKVTSNDTILVVKDAQKLHRFEGEYKTMHSWAGSDSYYVDLEEAGPITRLHGNYKVPKFNYKKHEGSISGVDIKEEEPATKIPEETNSTVEELRLTAARTNTGKSWAGYPATLTDTEEKYIKNDVEATKELNFHEWVNKYYPNGLEASDVIKARAAEASTQENVAPVKVTPTANLIKSLLEFQIYVEGMESAARLVKELNNIVNKEDK